MSYINLVEGLFFGKEELFHLQKFSNEDIRKILGLATYSYGFVDLSDINKNPTLGIEGIDSFKVKSSSKMEVQINNPSYLFAYPYNFVYWGSAEYIKVPEIYKGKNIWMKVSYYQHSIESGTLKIDSEGNVVGVGTEFTSKLRGEPNFPSRITLYAKNSDGQLVKKMTYDVLSVNSDTSILIDSYGGIDDTSLTYHYAVAGTFEEGTLVGEEEQYPFRYDGCKIEFVQETSSNKIPDEDNMRLSNTEFYIAKLLIDAEGNIVVEDKRGIFNDLESAQLKIWTLKSEFTFDKLAKVRDNLQKQITTLSETVSEQATLIENMKIEIKNLKDSVSELKQNQS